MQLALTATVSAQAGADLNVLFRPFFRTGEATRRDLGESSQALGTQAQQQVPLQVNIGPCLADPGRVPSGPGCPLRLEGFLRRGTTVLDRFEIGPISVQPGQRVTPPGGPIQLVEIEEVFVDPPEVSLLQGQTQQFRATIFGPGETVLQRPVTWSTSAPTVLSVGPTGLATALGGGSATVTATVFNRTGTAAVTVTTSPILALAPTTVTFAAIQGAAAPAAQAVQVTNAGGGTLQGLVATVAYAPQQPTGWLTATLNQQAAPATLTLQAQPGQLALGTYTAQVSVAGTASNTPQTVAVTLTVSPAPVAPLIGLSATTAAFAGNVGQSAVSPASTAIAVSNAGTGGAAALTGLSATVAYAAQQPTGWLAATLDQATSPATLTLTPTTGTLAAGTYTATVSVASPVAGNSPQAVAVTFTVSALPPLLRLAADSAVATGPAGQLPTFPLAPEWNRTQNHVIRVPLSNANGPLGALGTITVQPVQYTGTATNWLSASVLASNDSINLAVIAPANVTTAGVYRAIVTVTSANDPVGDTFVVRWDASAPVTNLQIANIGSSNVGQVTVTSSTPGVPLNCTVTGNGSALTLTGTCSVPVPQGTAVTLNLAPRTSPARTFFYRWRATAGVNPATFNTTVNAACAATRGSCTFTIPSNPTDADGQVNVEFFEAPASGFTRIWVPSPATSATDSVSWTRAANWRTPDDAPAAAAPTVADDVFIGNMSNVGAVRPSILRGTTAFARNIVGASNSTLILAPITLPGTGPARLVVEGRIAGVSMVEGGPTAFSSITFRRASASVNDSVRIGGGLRADTVYIYRPVVADTLPLDLGSIIGGEQADSLASSVVVIDSVGRLIGGGQPINVLGHMRVLDNNPAGFTTASRGIRLANPADQLTLEHGVRFLGGCSRVTAGVVEVTASMVVDDNSSDTFSCPGVGVFRMTDATTPTGRLRLRTYASADTMRFTLRASSEYSTFHDLEVPGAVRVALQSTGSFIQWFFRGRLTMGAGSLLTGRDAGGRTTVRVGAGATAVGRADARITFDRLTLRLDVQDRPTVALDTVDFTGAPALRALGNIAAWQQLWLEATSTPALAAAYTFRDIRFSALGGDAGPVGGNDPTGSATGFPFDGWWYLAVRSPQLLPGGAPAVQLTLQNPSLRLPAGGTAAFPGPAGPVRDVTTAPTGYRARIVNSTVTVP